MLEYFIRDITTLNEVSFFLKYWWLYLCLLLIILMPFLKSLLNESFDSTT